MRKFSAALLGAATAATLAFAGVAVAQSDDDGPPPPGMSDDGSMDNGPMAGGPMGGAMGVPRAEVLRALADRGLIFELMAHPDLLESAAETLADFDDLTIAVEHAGWPRSDEPEERALWERGVTALAALGDHVHCKLSGLAMPLHSNDAAVLRPWIEFCLDAGHLCRRLPHTRRHATPAVQRHVQLQPQRMQA